MDIIDYIIDSKYEDFSVEVINEAKKCLLDTVGVSIMGSQTKLSKIVNDFSKEFYSGHDSQSLFHQTKMSQLGALYTSAMSIDAFDMHDGHVLTKGHVGVSVVPASLLIHNNESMTGKEVLANIIIAYEISVRAGIALHDSTSDYHTSGAWNSLGVCAIACRVLKLSKEQTKHALGICEFYSPRSQMMKIIDTPSMLKDGSGFGSFVGLKAALLAKSGFTGAPSLVLYSEDTKKHWQNLGKKFEILKQYFKPYPVCRWAQPAIEAANYLNKNFTFNIDDIKNVTIESFHESTRLNNNIPNNTEEAQYALKYPAVLSLAQTDLTKKIVTEDFDLDKDILELFNKTNISENSSYNEQFPKKRFSNICIEMKNGDIFKSGDKEAIWGEDNTPSYDEIKSKFYDLNKEIYKKDILEEIQTNIFTLENLDDITQFRKLI